MNRPRQKKLPDWESSKNKIIINRPEMKSTFHHTLITLAVTDILFLAVLIVDTKRFDLDLDNQMFIMLFPYVWNPCKNILMNFESFLMMSISTERFLAIRRPLEYRKRYFNLPLMVNLETWQMSCFFPFLGHFQTSYSYLVETSATLGRCIL